MKIIDKIKDNRINATNVLINITLGEYCELATQILQSNPFQRRRVKTSGTVYSLLKSDLRQGIVIPPIVLGLNIDNATLNLNDDKLIELIQEKKNNLLILDGLQRTHTIKDLMNELYSSNDPNLQTISNYPLRIEIYLGINKLGILYRMLTLNTGQTPMSSRHQIEIIYSNYHDINIPDIKLIKHVDNKSPHNVGEYNFKDVIDGFTSYLERDYLAIERTDILDNIKSLEKLALESQDKDAFIQFVELFDLFMKQMIAISQDWSFNPKELNKSLGASPFGHTVIDTFNNSQVMTGFGSAIGKLTDLEVIKGLNDLYAKISGITSDNPKEDYYNLVQRLDEMRAVAKKVGNDQRLFFHHFFRSLFNQDADGYLKFGEAINQSFRHYERITKA